MTAKKQDISFENAFKKLEKIVEDLENGELSLEDSLLKFEEGIKLSKICTEKLENAQKKIEVLLKDSKGEFKFEDLDSEDGNKKEEDEEY